MSAPPNDRRAFVSVAEVAAVLGVSERTVREYLYQRDPSTGRPLVPHVRFGRRVLIPRTWLEAFVAEAQEEARR
jgi:hypothetical protein